MSFLNKILGRLEPASIETIQCCLENAEKDKTVLEGTRVNRTTFQGAFLRETPSEIILKCGNAFVGIKKDEIAKIAICKTSFVLPQDNTLPDLPNDQKSYIEVLKTIPSIDPPLDDEIFELVTDTKSVKDLQQILRKNKWICYYDGRYLKSENLSRSISVPKASKPSLPQTGYYLCSVYAMKGKIPPILILSNASYITKELVSVIQNEHNGLTGNTATQKEIYGGQVKDNPSDSEKQSPSVLIEQLRTIFKRDQTYKLSVVGDAVKLTGFDVSDFGYSKLLDFFVSLQSDEIELGQDEIGHPTITFHWKEKQPEQPSSGKDEAWRAFIAAFTKTCQFNKDYQLASLTFNLAMNGFKYKDYGFSRMLACLESFPHDLISISSDANGHPLIKVFKTGDEQEEADVVTEDDNQQENKAPLSRRGLISAYYLSNKAGFMIESLTNQTWMFHDNTIKEPELLRDLQVGVTGQTVLFCGDNTPPEGALYPSVTSVCIFDETKQRDYLTLIQEAKETQSDDKNENGVRYSPFAIQQMSECPYCGIDTVFLQGKASLEENINDVTSSLKLFRKTKEYNPKELSKYYLTLAALHFKSDKDDVEISRCLKSYFRWMAEACLFDSSMPCEVGRLYSVEALRLFAPAQESSLKLCYLLFLSYAPSLGASRGHKTSEDIHALLEKMKETSCLQPLISDLPYYKEEIPQFMPVILNEMKDFVFFTEADILPSNRVWEMIVPLCKNVKSISNVVLSQTREALLPLSTIFSGFDHQRYNRFMEILSAILEYSQRRFFVEKESVMFQIKYAVKEFMRDYGERPTALLSEAFVPALNHLKERVEEDYQNILNLVPELQVESIANAHGYDLSQNSTLELKLSVCNLNEVAPPIESIVLSLKDRACQESFYPGPLGGNQKQKEMSLLFEPTEKEIEDRAFSVNVMVSFQTRKGKKQAGPFPISVQLEKVHYEPIPNPYSRYEGGNPIDPTDEDMFFGRDSLVQEICEHLSQPYSGQCYVLYGQKRSGKTSVMKLIQNHLLPGAFYTCVSAQAFNYAPEKLLSTFAKHVRAKVLAVAEDTSVELQDFPSSDYANSDPVLALKQISRSLKKQNRNWIVSVDEFTSIYSNARKNAEALQNAEAFMHAWKALLQDHVFNALIIGQDTMPQFKQAFPNDFCVSHNRRLTFLDEEGSIALATEPIANGEDSRYRGNALAMLYRKTAGSPYFLQKFCSEIVMHLNKNGHSVVTEADIDFISDGLVHDRLNNSLRKEDFDALVVAGDPKLSLVPNEILWKVLAVIALHSDQTEWCRFSDLEQENIPDFKEAVKDLQNRDTIQVENDEVRIRVELFADWLRINNKGIL